VGDWMGWLGLGVLTGLMLFATLNVTLRVPSRVRMAEQFERIGRKDQFESFIAARPHYLLATSVLYFTGAIALLNIGLSLAETTSAGIQTTNAIGVSAITLLLLWVFGIAIPNAWAKYGGVWLVVHLLPLLVAVRFLLLPLIVVLQWFDPLVRRLAGVPVRDARSYADEWEQEILDVVSEGERHGAVDEEEKEMIESVIELGDTRVEEIMTPRTDMAALSKESDLATVLQAVRTKGHSRIPVYDDTIDTILGVLYAKDLLLRNEEEPFELKSIMRKVLFIPESKHVRELLREFQEQKVHIAIVLDEYGGTAGLVTIEDILEELVGEIHDEYDPSAPVELKRIDEATVEVDARMRIDDLNDELNIDLPEDEDYETIGGFVFSRLGKIPKVGERFAHEDMAIDVIDAEPRRVTRLRLHLPTPSHQNRVSD